MLRDASNLDVEAFAFAGSGERAASSIVDIQGGASGATATIPDAHLLFNADFIRSGHDLILRGHDGGSAMVRDYFATDERPALLSREGAKLSGDLVEAMSGPLAPNQYAQAGTPAPAAADAVGRVVTSSGDASIIRNGVAVTLKPGDPVLRADVLQTAAGTMAVTFNDGSTLNLTANTRIVVSEFVYSPNGAGNSQLLNLVQGSLTFISGEVAHSGNMRIGTPVATMGIRGTVGGVTTANDGTVHFYVSQSATGAVIINEQGQIIANVVQDGPMIIVRPVGPLQVVAEEIQKTPAQLALELQALQQIVSIKAVGDQLLQQFFQQQNPNDPNPQSPKDQPHTQIQINLNYAQNGAGGDLPGGDTPRPFDDATVHLLSPNPDLPVTLPTVIDLAHANLPPVTFAPLNVAMNEDQTLTFSGARTISVHDVDSRELTVTVSVTHGILSLAGAAGLNFAPGHGASGATLTFTGPQAVINAALHGMIFTPSADYNGGALLTITANDGDSPAVTTSIPIEVAAVNDAPVLDYFNVNVAEGDTVTLTPADFHVTDPDGAAVIFTVSNVTGGYFMVGSGSNAQFSLFTAHTGPLTFTAEDIAAGRVKFVHDGGENPPSFTITVSDGITSGTPVTETGTITQHVNDAPVLGGANSTPVTYTENDCATVVNASLTISDVDSATLNGATVTVAANFESGDVLSFTSHGGITGSYNAQTGVLTLSGVASLSDYQAVLRSVTYENTGSDPSDAPRTIEFQVDDGSAEHSASNVFSTVVDVVPENSAPVLSLGGHVADQFASQAYDLNSGTARWTSDWTENENGDYAPSPTTGEIHIATDPSVSDTGFRLFLSDDDNEAGAPDTIQRSADLSGATSATLSFDYRRQIDFGDQSDVVRIWASDDGVNFTEIGQIGSNGSAIVDQSYQHFSVDISGFISPTTTIRFSVDDGVDDGDWFYIDNVRIDYSGASGSSAYVEGGSPISIVPDGALIDDVDDTTLQSATITLTNAQSGDVLSVFGQLPTGIVASSYNAQTGVLTLSGAAALADYQSALAQIQFSNSGDNPGGADRTITIVVSDGLANSNAGTVTVHVTPVNDAPVSSDSANPATFTEDADTVIPFSALLANASDPDGDTLSIVNVASSSAYGGTVTVNGTDITYHPATNFTGFDYFLYSVTDGHGGTIQRAATFTVASVNDAPVLDAHSAALSYGEGQSAAAIASAITVADVDSSQLTGAKVQITGNFSSSEDVLGFVNQNGITGSYNSATGLLTLTGLATLAQYQAALASVTYSNMHALSTATRTISFTVDDGQTANHASNAVTVDVTVAAVNDTLDFSATAWAASGSIDLGGGVNVLNVTADGADISAGGTPTVAHVDTGNLTGTSGTDSIALTGLQLDNVIIGSGKIDLGAGTGDTINLKSTSADLNTLGATDAGIVGVEVISAAGAGAGVSIDVHGQSEAFTITGSANVDTLIGGSDADTINGGDGSDIITGGAGADHLNGGAGADAFVLTSPSDLTGDTIDGVHDNANDDTVRLNGAGTYDFSTAAVSNIDSVNIGVDAAGFNIVLTDEMASTAAYKGTNTAIEGRIRVAASTAVTSDVTIDASDLQAGHRLFVNAQNLGGNDTVIGGAGNDNIGGGAGNDTITGGAGNDDLTGGAGSNTFVFHAGFGADTISDFDETLDYLQFDQALFADVNALLAATTDNGTNTFIEYDASNKVTLQGVLKADLMAHTDHILIV